MSQHFRSMILSETERPFAIRLAAHLRMVAIVLRERGEGAPPVDAQRYLQSAFWNFLPARFWRAFFANWLQIIIQQKKAAERSPSVDSIQNVLQLIEQCIQKAAGSERYYFYDESSELIRKALEFLRPISCRRLYVHTGRMKIDPDLAVVYSAAHAMAYSHGNSIAYWALNACYYWICQRLDMRFRLTTDCASRLENLAGIVELTASLPRSTPRWGKKAFGRWKSVAYNLVMQFDNSTAYFAERVVALGGVADINVLDLLIEPVSLMEFGNINLVALCRKPLEAAAARDKDRLRVAHLTMKISPSGIPLYRVVIETWIHGYRIEGILARGVKPFAYKWVMEDIINAE